MVMITVVLPFALSLALYAHNPTTPAAQSPVPSPAGTTPGACLTEVRDYVAKRRAEVPLVQVPTQTAGMTAEERATQQAMQAAAALQRAQLLRQIDVDRLTMAKACAAKFDPKTAADNTLADLASLYSEAAMPELAKATIDRGLKLTTLSEPNRAALLLMAVQTGLREPISPDRNVRLESLIDAIDALPDTVIEQKFSAHYAMNNYYRYDDIDAGIVEHSTWMIDAAKRLTPEQRKKLGVFVLSSAYVNMAQAWAGQGKNDDAIALLRRAPADLPDVPNVLSRVQPDIERLQLVGTAAAPLTAPRWLNLAGGQTTLDLKGKVTLLEFSAHWCVPCKESYPGVNRLREKYGSQGFQVVLATRLWGYFQAERPLDADTEFARDKTYFAEHGLDVPIAVGNGGTAGARDPNDLAYKVGGIPQIHLIDKQGRIRLVMVGYDDANEPKLSKMIADLLKEK